MDEQTGRVAELRRYPVKVLSDDPDRDRRQSEALGRSVAVRSVAPDGAAYELSVGDLHGLEPPSRIG